MEKTENFEIKGKWSNVNYVPLNFEIVNLAVNNNQETNNNNISTEKKTEIVS